MISFQNISKTYDGQTQAAVNNVSFIVNQGETVVLVGPSGSGKTTLLKMIPRLIEPSAGNIELDNKTVRSLDPIALRRQIGYVLQNVGLFPHLTVEENITLVLKLQKRSKRVCENRAHELLDLMDLKPSLFAKRYTHELSGGQQQRIGIARALATDPNYLLMDEPFSALDPMLRDELQSKLLHLNKTLGKTILFVTHNITEALRLGDNIAIMHKGQLAQFGTANALMNTPANEFVKNFMATATQHKLGNGYD